jgi:hypothetical protein
VASCQLLCRVDERIRWYTFISQCIISLMIMGIAIAMLSIKSYGPTSIYLTIITGEGMMT